MNEQRSGSRPDQTNRPWVALVLYLAVGWAAADILLTVRERLGVPEVLDNIVLGLLLAGLAAYALLVATGRLARQSPLVSVSRILAVSIVAASVALGIAAWLGQDEQTASIPSVAVLPCEFRGDADHTFLGPAASQEIHARLAKVAGLRIPAWRSVLKSVQAGEDPQQIAYLLGVEHLARCAIAEDEDGIELSTTVLDPKTEELIWSGRQTYASADLVQALGDISVAIADALSVRLTANESDRVTRAPTSSPEAYEHYLRARHAQGSRQFTIPNILTALAVGEEDYKTAMKHYRAAVDLDPDFAEAWAGMGTVTGAFAFVAPGQSFAGSEERTYNEQAKDFARRALTLDACNAEALLATKPGFGDTDVDDQLTQGSDSWGSVRQRSIAQVQRAIDCEPNNASAWLARTRSFTYFSLWPSAGTRVPAAEARAALKQAVSLDPTNCPVVAYYIGIFRSPIWAPRPEDRLTLEETKQAIRSALLVDPECGNMYDILYRISVQQGRMDEAIAWKMRRHELDPDNVFISCPIGIDIAKLGFLEEAQPWLDRANDSGQFYACVDRTYLECLESREAFFSERCMAYRLGIAEQLMASDYASASDREQVFKYRQALYEAATRA
jgi:tetratricopeptide (TPR) repeat protein